MSQTFCWCRCCSTAASKVLFSHAAKHQQAVPQGEKASRSGPHVGGPTKGHCNVLTACWWFNMQLDLNIRGCGSWLQQDSRTRHARPPPRAKRRDWQMPPPPPPASLPGVASSAAKGEFRGDVDRFMAAVREGVALVKQAQARKGSNSSRQGSTSAR